LKFEGGNPTGTQKDRVAFAQAMDALRRGSSTPSRWPPAATSAWPRRWPPRWPGFAASSISRALTTPAGSRRWSNWARKSFVFPATMKRRWRLQPAGRKRGMVRCQSGGQQHHAQLTAYGGISYEIYDELGDAPAAVALPVSNGTTFAGVCKGFVQPEPAGQDLAHAPDGGRLIVSKESDRPGFFEEQAHL
jgi:threonine synthase